MRCRGEFGAEATQEQVQAELAEYSDHALHALCAASLNKDLRALQLQPEQARLLHLLLLLYLLLPLHLLPGRCALSPGASMAAAGLPGRR